MKITAYQKTEKKKTPLTRKKWWKILLIVVLVLAVGAGGLLFYVNARIYDKSKYVSGWNQIKSSGSGDVSTDSDGKATLDDSDFDNIQGEDYPIIKVKQKDPDIENILLIGIDGGDPGVSIGHRSDSMIVASFNKKDNTVKMASILRDIKAYFPDRKAWGKLNASYAYGGAGQVVNIINYNFKLDIQQYLLVDFSGFKNIINTVGGVSIQVSSKEATQIDGLHGAGTYTLNGTQALQYARIREIDTDFMRTQRQRNVIMAIANKFKNASVITKTSSVNECMNYIKTNMPATDLASLLLSYSSSLNGNIPQLEVPSDENGMYTVETSPVWYFDLNWDQEVPVLQKFLYGSN